jgi:predicted transcriptional regulator
VQPSYPLLGHVNMKVGYNFSLTAHSNVRTDALISLSGGLKSLDDLLKDLNVRSTTALHSLRDLKDDKLIYQDAERNYVLTTIGTIITNGLVIIAIQLRPCTRSKASGLSMT